jgi:GDP-L-fucose synthase
MNKDARIIITGSTGLIGTALVPALAQAGYTNVLALGSKDCDLMDWHATRQFFADHPCDCVIHMAALVYGMMGNIKNKGTSFLNNLLINTHTVEAARLAGAKKLVVMGSGCVYPYPPPSMPLQEDMVWSGPPHHTEDSYGHAKRAMLAQLIAYKEQYGLPWAFIMSGNFYGPNDKFDAEFGHVTPALVRKFYEAKQAGKDVVVWGTGIAKRDFTYSGDTARALIAIMENIEGAVNLASGQVHSIREVVEELARISGMEDHVVWDSTKPDGEAYRAYDSGRLFATGFRPQVSLAEGLRLTYDWYAAHADSARK